MNPDSPSAETNIHLRAKAQDRDLIDRAAELVGANRSQFMLSSALKAAKNVLLAQTTIHTDAKAFRQILDRMDEPPTPEEGAGLKRLAAIRPPWPRD